MTKVARWTVLGALFLIPFIPLYVANSLFFPFITGKGFAFRILVEIAVVGWGILMLLEPKYRPRFSWTLVLYGALIAWMAVANFLGANPHKAFWSNYERMDGWVTLIHVFGFFLVAGSMLAADKLWRKWWLTFLGASAFIALYGLLQVAGVFQIHQGGVRLDATFGNSAYLAAYLLFVLAAALWHGFESKGWMRYALFALAVVQAYLLFLTATRGAILGAVGAVFFGGILWTISAKGKARKVGIGLIVGVLALVGGFLLVKDTAFVQGDPTLERIASISVEDGFARLAIWNMAVKGISERPVTGWGQDGFNFIFNTHYEPSMYTQEPWFDRAHSIYLDWAVAGGVPALLLFLALMATASITLYRRGDPKGRIFLLSALAAYAFQGLFVFDNLFTYVPVAAILAMAHGVSSRPIARLENAPVLSPALAQNVAVPVGAMVLVVLIWSVNVPSMLAANDLIRAMTQRPGSDPQQNLEEFKTALSRGSFATQEIREQIVTFAIAIDTQGQHPQEVKDAVANMAVAEILKQIEVQPGDARLYAQLSNAHRSHGDFESALLAIREAQALMPKKQTLYTEEGIIAIQAGKYEVARDAFRKAYELDTSFDDLAGYVAAGEIFANNEAASKAFLVEHFGTSTVDHNLILVAYYQTKNYEKVYEILKRRIENEPQNHAHYFQLASVYGETGKVNDARAVLRELSRARPDLSRQISSILEQLPR